MPPVHRVPGAGDDVTIGAGAEVRADGYVGIRSGLVESGGSLRIRGDLTLSDGLTNAGAILFDGPDRQTLEVTAGTFLNIGDFTYRGGDYNGYVFAKLDNRGTIAVEAGYLSIDIGGNSDTRPQPVDPAYTLTNTGRIVFNNGAACYAGGVLHPNDLGTVEGDGRLQIEMIDWHLDADWTVPTTEAFLALANSSITGAGTVTIPNGARLGVGGSIIDVDVVNHGILVASDASIINGQLELPADSILAVGWYGKNPKDDIALTVTRGFTNRGTIDMSPASAGGYDLTVTTGTLVNAAGATITCHGTGIQSGASITAQVDNQGTINVSSSWFSINPDWAPAHNLSWAFTNTGAIHTGNDGMFTLGGRFTPSQGTIDGNGGLGFEGADVQLDSDWSPAIPVFSKGSTIDGPGKLTIAAGNGLLLGPTTINATVDNRGLLAAFGLADVSVTSPLTPALWAINGPLTMTIGSELLVGFDPEASANTSPPYALLESIMQQEGKRATDANLTIENGFLNQGQIRLSAVGDGSTLSVINGTLVNSSDGSITSSRGAFSGGQGNFLNAQLDNQGAIRIVDANLTINQQPAGSAFALTNKPGGTIDVAAGQTLRIGGTEVVNRGAMQLVGSAAVDFGVPTVTIDGQGSLRGDPEGTVHVRGSLLGNTQNLTSHRPPGTVWLDGAGTAAAPQLLEVLQVDQGDVAAGYANNLAYGDLKLGAGTYVKLVNQADNSPGAGGESADAAYAGSLSVPVDATLDVNGLHLYAHRAFTIQWTGDGDGRLWSDPDNWVVAGTNAHRVPGSSDDVLIGGAAAIESNNSVTIRSLQVESGASLDNVGGMTVTDGLANFGTIYLGSQWGADLKVSAGTLLNGPGGTIVCSKWTGEWTYNAYLTANIVNQGTITAHRSYFQINVLGNSGGHSPSGNFFTNTGTIQLNDGANCSIAGLAAPEDLGRFQGNGLLSVCFVNWILPADWTVPSQDSVVFGLRGVLSVDGTVTNPAGNMFVIFGSMVNADIANHGTLVGVKESVINGQLTLPPGSVLTVGLDKLPYLDDPPNDPFDAKFTITEGFTNHGRIDLFNMSSGSTLYVGNGTLVNASDGIITSSLGVFSDGQGNFLDAQLENRGTLSVMGASLTINEQPAGSAFGLTNELGGTRHCGYGDSHGPQR